MNITRKALPYLLILALFTASGVFAQVDRTKKPSPGPAPKAAFPAFHESTLKNGLKVFVVQDTEQPLVTFRLLIKSGSEFDGKEKSGLASIATDLLTKGTTTRNALAFAKESDFHGISIGASAADDMVSLSGSGLKKHMQKILELMTDALFHPTFPEEELDKTRKQILSGLAVNKKSPEEISSRLEITRGFNRHPYANFETEATVSAIKREDLVGFHTRYFIPNNTSIAIVGDVSPKEILPILEKYFGSWKTGAAPKSDFPLPEPITTSTVHLVDLGSTQTQTTLSIVTTGMPRNNPDWPLFGLLNSLLGGGSSSRLYNNLREKHGFTYGAYCSADGRKQAGIWTATASVRRVATDSSIKEILHEMKRLQDEPIPADELDMHKQYLAGTYLLTLESPARTAQRVQDIDLYGLPKDYYATYVSKIMKATSADLQRIARQYLRPDNVAITAVGDASALLESLKAFGTVKMYDPDMQPIDASAMAKPDIDAETLIARHIQALGGADKMSAVKDRSLEGTITMNFQGQSIQGTMSDIKKAPNKSYQKTVLNFMGQEMVQEKWNDGTTVVSTTPMAPEPIVLEGEELAQELEKDIFNELLRYKELGYTVAVTGKKPVDGKPAYVLTIKRTHGTGTYFIDANSYLMLGEETMQKTPAGEQAIMVSYGDYRQVDGVMLPFKVKMDAGMMGMEMEVVKYVQNSTVPDETFKAK